MRSQREHDRDEEHDRDAGPSRPPSAPAASGRSRRPSRSSPASSTPPSATRAATSTTPPTSRSAAARRATSRCARSPSTPRRSATRSWSRSTSRSTTRPSSTARARTSADQYRSVIFAHSDEQAEVARRVIERAQERFRDPIVTAIEPAKPFWRAEEYHQCYLQNRSGGPAGDAPRPLKPARAGQRQPRLIRRHRTALHFRPARRPQGRPERGASRSLVSASAGKLKEDG